MSTEQTVLDTPWTNTSHNHDYWTGTNDGHKIDLLHPDMEQITLEDMATALGNLCRFNGQINRFYSVAEHCLNVSALVPARYRLEALLHDAPEAYICDIPTPLKRLLGSSYHNVEDTIAAAIGDKFGLDLVNLPACVKEADRIMVVTERDALQDHPLVWPEVYENSLRSPNFRAVWGYHAGPEWLSRVQQELNSRGLTA